MRRSERIAACALRHTNAVGGWTPGDDEYLKVVIAANGHPHLKAVCRNCTDVSPALPMALWTTWRRYFPGDLVWQLNPSYERDSCVVRGCASADTEYHHFAPWNTFGRDADKWPCLPVCKAHHREWHTRMDGYRWRARGVA